jgi:hypothetical protein
MLAFAQRNNGIAVTFLGSAIAGLFAILLTLLWEGIVPVTLLIALASPFVALRSGMPRRYVFRLLLLATVIVGGILAVNAYSPVERLQNNTSASIASIIFLGATGLLLITISKYSGIALNLLHYYCDNSNRDDSGIVRVGHLCKQPNTDV